MSRPHTLYDTPVIHLVRKLLVPAAYCLLLTAYFVLAETAVLACPLCKEALFSPGEAAAQSRVVQGYAISIAVLLGIPILLVGGLALWLVRSARRTKHL